MLPVLCVLTKFRRESCADGGGWEIWKQSGIFVATDATQWGRASEMARNVLLEALFVVHLSRRTELCVLCSSPLAVCTWDSTRLFNRLSVSFNGVSDCHKVIRVFQLLSCTFFLVKFGNNTNKRKNRQFGISVTISRVQKLVHLREKDDFCTHLYGRNLDLSIQKIRKIIVT